MAERVGFTFGYCKNGTFMFFRWSKHISKNNYRLNIIVNIPGIFFKKPGNIMEFCQSRNVETLIIQYWYSSPLGQYLDDDDTENITVLERALGEYVALTGQRKDEDRFSTEVICYESHIRQQVWTITFQNFFDLHYASRIPWYFRSVNIIRI